MVHIKLKRIPEIIKLKCKILILLSFSIYTGCVTAQNIDSTDVESYKLSVDFSKFKTQKISGVAEIKCKPLNGVKTKNILFMLLKLKVDSVFYKSADSSIFTKVNFTYNDTFIKIHKSLSKLIDIKIYYQGTPIKDALWGGFYFQGEYAYNMGVGFASNPHNYGRVWFPCIDNFTDKALYSYSVEVPRGYAAVCGGNFKDTVQNTDNTTTWNWEHTYPISTYLASVAVAPYKLLHSTYSGINKSIPIILNAEAKDTLNLKNSFKNLPKAMAAFELFYGPYRFERVGFSLVPFDAGAMEHACNIAYPKLYCDGSLNYETLMAHELSHHWWGNNTTCRYASDMWLNEGWAAYSEALFTEFVYGKQAYQNYINTIHKGVLQFAHLQDGAATAVNNVSHQNTYGRHVYKKGADMVHCIRGVMGDEAFKEKCKTLMETYKMANLTTQDFSNHFNIPNEYVKQIISDTGFAHFSIYSLNSTKVSTSWNTTLSYKQKKRFGHHVYESMPYEVFAFDKNFKKQVFKFNFGTPAPISFSTNFKPEFVCFDYDQKFSDAITDDVIITDSIGTYTFNYSMMSVNISQNTDTSLIRIEHNWVYPDAWFLNIPNITLSKERYWTVNGIFDPSLKASATITYDGSKPTNYSSGWLDNQLLEGRSEDSLILLYRPNAESYWQLETNAIKTMGISKNDKKGSFTINELKKGEYAFGVRGKLSGTGSVPVQKEIKLFPNPANDEIRIEWANTLTPERVEIVSATGQTMLSIKLDKNSTSEIINTKLLSNGHYFASIITPDLKRMGGEFVILR
ncbi:MAG: M1 family aminopeptidase [Bacteroidia bacterium]